MSLAEAFAGLKQAPAQAKRTGAQEPKRLGAQEPRRLSAEAGTAKSRHPDFEPFKVYLRTATKKRALRKWEDEDGGDFSDLVERLLADYARGGLGRD